MLGISDYKDKSQKNDYYHKKLNAAKALQPPKAAKTIVHWLLGFGIVFIVTLFLPWQQNINADGKVTALLPEDRPQTIESAIAGRIQEWKVREGFYVKKGDTILVLAEIKDKFFDPELLMRLEEQLNAKKGAIGSTQEKVGALERQIGALEANMDLSLSKARNKLQQSQFELISDSTYYESEKANYKIAERQLQGQLNLFEKGLTPLVKLESAKVKIQEANAKLTSAENKFLASRNKVLNAMLEINSTKAEYLEKISKAQSDKSGTQAYVSDAVGSLSKLKNEYVNMEIRSKQYAIVAPQEGYIVRAMKAGLGETIKEGEAVATIMPSNPSMAVELYVKAMDVPLLSLGRNVRIQFDGWPALQFSGWPSVSVGTFGGRVEVIDMVNSKGGKYRILVTPDKNDIEWPNKLRQGSGVYAWVMLDDVPLWFEAWRQLNGFPPSLQDEPDELYFGEKEKKSKDKGGYDEEM